MKKILVAGGMGFLGSHLVESLLEDGNDVYVIDNGITGDAQIKGVFYLIDDVCNVKSLISKESKFDEIYHLASIASPVKYQQYPLMTALANSHGTLELLSLALEHKAKFLYASTSEIYGDALECPQKETYYGNVNSFGPRSCYDESKRFGEMLCYIFKNEGVDVKIARIFNTYGVRMKKRDGRVLTNFINQALENKPLTIQGGNQTRCFCYVDDTVRGLKIIMSKGDNNPYNLGNNIEYTIEEIGQIVSKLIKVKYNPIYLEIPKDDPIKRKPDISRIKELGWKPMIKIEDGIMRMIKEQSLHCATLSKKVDND